MDQLRGSEEMDNDINGDTERDDKIDGGERLADAPGDEVIGGASNRPAHETFTDGLRASMGWPAVTDPKLDALIEPLYCPNATVGSASTAAAVRQEHVTGEPVGEHSHSQKATNGIRSLEKWLEKNQTASPSDRAAAENIIRGMKNALEGR